MNEYFQFIEKKEKLDKKDKKILSLLFESARMTLANISRKTGIPKDSVLYRIRRFEKLGICTYHTIISPAKIGCHVLYFVNLSLYHLSEEKEKELEAFFKTYKYSTYFAKTSGKYDYVVGIMTRNMEEFDFVLKQIKSKFGQQLRELELMPILKEYKYDDMTELIE